MYTSAYKFLSWFFYMICLNLFIAENNIQSIYRDSIILETKFEKKFEGFVCKKINITNRIGDKDAFYNIVHTYKSTVYNKFKKMVQLKEDIELSTGNIRISLVFHNYCTYFKDYMDDGVFKLFSKLVPFGSYPNLCDLYLIINGKDLNLLLYPDVCFDYFIEKID